jgi:hypothetical protein
LAVRDGVALFAAPGGVPVIFDYEGVNQVIGDLAERLRRDVKCIFDNQDASLVN